MLGYSFLWSLREGAIKEQVVIVEKQQAVERQERLGAQDNDGEDKSSQGEGGDIQLTENPMRKPHAAAAVAPSNVTGEEKGEETWTTYMDEDSGRRYRVSSLTGETVWIDPEAEEEEAEEVEETWTTYMDEDSGWRYRVSSLTGETIWIDPEAEEEVEGWTIHMDEDSGRRYRVSSWTGETVWVDPEVIVQEKEEVADAVEVNDGDDLATAKSRLRRVMSKSADGTNSGMDAAFLALVSDTRGDWVEVCDTDGSVLGAQLKGCTVYYNRETYEMRLTKPPGWVLLQVVALTGEGRASRRIAPLPRVKSEHL